MNVHGLSPYMQFRVILLCMSIIMNGRNLITIRRSAMADSTHNHQGAMLVCKQTPPSSADCVIKYSSSELLQLRDRVYHHRALNQLPTKTVDTLKELNITRKRKRGKRLKIRPTIRNSFNLQNLQQISSVASPTYDKHLLAIGLINARSAKQQDSVANKPMEIHDLITDNHLDGHSPGPTTSLPSLDVVTSCSLALPLRKEEPLVPLGKVKLRRIPPRLRLF